MCIRDRAEDDATLEHRGRVVEVHDRRRRALDRVEGALDEAVSYTHLTLPTSDLV